MPVSPAYQPDPQFPKLGPRVRRPGEGRRLSAGRILRFRNDRAAATVGLDTLSDAEWTAHFGRFEPLPGNLPEPLALRYHGHQFRSYNPEIGDGRGFLFAQLRESGTGRLLDLGTKGSGQTPYSRFGDGRLTLKGGVREVLATAMLESLGVPTSRSFSLIETGEALQRNDEPSPTRAGVLTRLSHSHVRFGTFQRHAYFDRADLIGELVEYAVELYYPGLGNAADKPLALFQAVLARSAELVGRWMAAGFVHGVLNTDNMNLTGESFDYGPYRFLPRNDPNFTAAYFDENGLGILFGAMPAGGRCSGTCAMARRIKLTLVTDVPTRWSRRSTASPPPIARRWRRACCAGSGWSRAAPRPTSTSSTPPSRRWRKGARRCVGSRSSSIGSAAWPQRRGRWPGPGPSFYGGEAFAIFRTLLGGYEADRPERLASPYFAAPEPQELLYDEIEALWAAISDRDDWAPFTDKLAAIEAARLGWSLS